MEEIIHVLPELIANQIAAGEVVQRPASVVKELMENSIDAGATKIDVVVKDAGRTMIQVIDDGKGMSPKDARTAFGRHATSKLLHSEDLYHIRTMGFRGEALASIAAVANVELVTRRPQDELAWKLEIDGSEITNEEPTIAPPGSRFTVRNIFYNVPARRKFLGDNTKEFRLLREEFVQIALVYPDIELTLTSNNELVYKLGKSVLKQRLLNIFGKRNGGILNKLLYPVDVSTQLIKISGFIGDPSSACRRDPLQYFFVNGRFIRHKFFRSAVLKAYETLVPAGMQPAYFLYFDVDPETIDINIHPTKTEVKFENEQAIWPIILASVRESLGKFNAVPSIDFDQEDAPEIRVFTGDRSVKPPKVDFDPSYNPFKQSGQHNSNWDLLFEGFQKGAGRDIEDYPKIKLTDDDLIKDIPGNSYAENVPDKGEELFAREQMKIDFNSPKFQLYGSYIVVHNDRSILFVDQNRAHTRILYDRFLRQLSSGKIASQTLLFPVELKLDQGQLIDLKGMAVELNEFGFNFDFSGDMVRVTSVPADSCEKQSETLVLDLMDSVRENGIATKTVRQEKLALRLAKATAIPYGQILSTEEMDDLIEKLTETAEQKYTPDGKNICSWLLAEEISKRF